MYVFGMIWSESCHATKRTGQILEGARNERDTPTPSRHSHALDW
jgi:hypothetical protein